MAQQKALRREMSLARETAKRANERAAKALQQALETENISDSTVKRRFDELKRRWDDTQQAHDKFVVQFMSASSKQAIIDEDKWINAIADNFYELEIKTDNFLHQNQNQQQIDAHQQQQQNHFHSGAIQLEPLKIDRFEGNLRRYPRFKHDFETMIYPFFSKHKEQLPIVLRSYLSPAVQEDVENIDNYDEMWNRLEEKYGNRQKLIDDILNDIELLDTNSRTSSSSESALIMIKTIERAHQDLVRLKEEAELHNALILAKIEKRMPAEMIADWIKVVISLSNKDKYVRLVPFLQEWRQRIEYTSANLRKPNKESTTNINDCWIHKCEHPIWECRVFQSMSVADRKQLTERNNACTSCLEIGHTVKACHRNFVCPESNCSENHNRLLHQ